MTFKDTSIIIDKNQGEKTFLKNVLFQPPTVALKIVKMVKNRHRVVTGRNSVRESIMPLATLIYSGSEINPLVDVCQLLKSSSSPREIKKLWAVGLMPNKSNPGDLLANLSKYNGSTSTSTGKNGNKRSWCAIDVEQPSQHAGEVNCLGYKL